MAGTSFSPFKSRFLLASSVLLLFTPPVFSMLIFFWPLLVSTALAVLAVVSFAQRGGISTGQEDEGISKSCIAGGPPDLAISPACHPEKISDVLIVGNQEVTWLEWLHNEDMEKCRARERLDCRPAGWDLNELDVVSEVSVGSLASGLEEKSVVDAYGEMVADMNFVEEQVESASANMIGFSQNGVCVRSLVDENMSLSGLASPVSDDVCRVDAFRCVHEDADVVSTNASPLQAGDMTIESIFPDKVSVLSMAAVETKGIHCDCTDISGTCCIHDKLVDNTVEGSLLDLAGHNGSDSGFAVGNDVLTRAVGGGALTEQGESNMRASSLDARDATTASQHDLEVVVENKASKGTSVVPDEGECAPPFLTSKAMSVSDASEVSFPKEGISFVLEREVSARHEMEDPKERDFREDNGGPIDKGDAEGRHSRDNDKGPIWDVSDDEEIKSSLRFSFFDNGRFTLNSSKG